MKKKILILLCSFLLLIGGGSLYYVNDYYHTLPEAEKYLETSETITIKENRNTIAFIPEESDTALIFYPGGKVEYTSYAPLLYSLAEKGILCILCEMPCNLAVLDHDAAKDIPSLYLEIKHWYIGGHSLGGSMAASFISDHTQEYDGLILLAAYSTEDLSNSSIDVLSIYGSEDKVLNKEKYNEYLLNLPSNTTEMILQGANHAYFGMYGEQDGDGSATLSNEEQLSITKDAILDFMK